MLRVKAAKTIEETRVLRLQFRVSLSDGQSELRRYAAQSLDFQRRAAVMRATWGHLLFKETTQ